MKSNQPNPFATRFVAPGKLAWIPNALTIEGLSAAWKANGRKGALMGPHGSGKSTLLEHFVPTLGRVEYRRDPTGEVVLAEQMTAAQQSERLSNFHQVDRIIWLQLRRASPLSMPIPWEWLDARTTLVVDGYEQLSYVARIKLLIKTKRLRNGLLVTAHRKTWLPTLCTLSVTADLAKQIAGQLLSHETEFTVPNERELEQALVRHHGNMREVLMELYDEYESRRSQN